MNTADYIKLDNLTNALGADMETIPYVDENNTNYINIEYENALNLYEDLIKKWDSNRNLALDEKLVMDTANAFRSFIISLAPQFPNVPSISASQSKFLKRLDDVGRALMSYKLLLSSGNIINDKIQELVGLTRMRNLKDLKLEDVFSDTGAGGGDTFRKKVFNHTSRNFSELFGIDDITSSIINSINNIELFDIKTYTFIMLGGPPGTGKSTIGQCIASLHSNGDYFSFNIGEMSDGTVGRTEIGIKSIFDEIHNNPDKNFTIILDEVDNIFASSLKQAHLNSVKITLQTEISGGRPLGNNVVIVGITNYLNNIAEPILRRVTSFFMVPLPQKNTLIRFLEKLMNLKFPNYAILSEEYVYNFNEFINTRNLTNANLEIIYRNAREIFIQRNLTFRTVVLENYLNVWRDNDLQLNNDIGFLQEERGRLLERKRSENKTLSIIPSVDLFFEASKQVAILSDEKLQEFIRNNTITNVI